METRGKPASDGSTARFLRAMLSLPHLMYWLPSLLSCDTAALLTYLHHYANLASLVAS